VGKQLSHSLAGLAEVQRKAQDLQAAQADQDMATLMATAEEYSRLISSVRVSIVHPNLAYRRSSFTY
jgi:sorting nexin-1/2